MKLKCLCFIIFVQTALSAKPETKQYEGNEPDTELYKDFDFATSAFDVEQSVFEPGPFDYWSNDAETGDFWTNYYFENNGNFWPPGYIYSSGSDEAPGFEIPGDDVINQGQTISTGSSNEDNFALDTIFIQRPDGFSCSVLVSSMTLDEPAHGIDPNYVARAAIEQKNFENIGNYVVTSILHALFLLQFGFKLQDLFCTKAP